MPFPPLSGSSRLSRTLCAPLAIAAFLLGAATAGCRRQAQAPPITDPAQMRAITDRSVKEMMKDPAQSGPPR